MQIKYNCQNVASFQELIESYPPRQFNSPRRSTVPLLSFWRYPPEKRIHSFYGILGLNPPGEFTAAFEYTVKPPQGKGKVSCTDLMFQCQSYCIAIEAKYTEPKYPWVEKWLQAGDINNRRKVLQGWLGRIGGVTGVNLAIEQVQKLEYQLIHRVASACSVDSTVCYVVYQVFDLTQKKQEYYSSQFDSFSRMLGLNSKLRLILLNVQIQPTDRYNSLKEKWQNGQRHLCDEVIKGLLNNDLMKFGKPQVVWSSGSNT
jgi:hypothetical protein